MISRRDFLGLMAAGGAMAALPWERLAAAQTGPAPLFGGGGKPDRQATLARNNPRVKSVAQDAVLSVGNGTFAFNVDCTGLQSLPATYTMIPLATLSHWAWHSKPVPAGMDLKALQYKMYPFHGKQVPYATSGTGQNDLFNYLRENPHRLNLGRIGLLLDAKALTPDQLANIDQTLDLATGTVTSRYDLAGTRVEVITCCHSDYDAIGIKVSSALLASGRLTLGIAFAYGITTFAGDGGDWSAATNNLHQTVMFEDPRSPKQVTLNRTVDSTRYGVRVDLTQAAGPLKELAPHRYQLTAKGDTLETLVAFDSEQFRATPLNTFAETRTACEKMWKDYWAGGAAIDFSDCTDPRAPELKRRIVLSQYLTAIHCAGQYPSQETGLLCNSWFGKFHLEMHWWHSVHFSYWDRQKHFGRSMFMYTKMLDSARARAARQGFKGARWPKMLGPDGEDSPSSVGPLIIWQQPHPIYFAELCYRDDPTIDTVKRWRDIVVETADFMASFAALEPARGAPGGGGQYVLGPAIRTVSENNKDADINPLWELTAWRFGLATAQKWLERLGQPRKPEWDAVLAKLSTPTIKEGVYMMQEGQDTFTPEWAWEHPAVLGALGVLPGGDGGGGIDATIMAATARKVRTTWDFSRIWGWDYPTAALCAARTLQPELAIDFLTMDAPTNKYLANGCNFQRGGTSAVPAYFPGNGGLLSAIALMAGGWDNGPTKPPGPLPGFPKDGKWNVKAEGFRRFI